METVKVEYAYSGELLIESRVQYECISSKTAPYVLKLIESSVREIAFLLDTALEKEGIVLTWQQHEVRKILGEIGEPYDPSLAMKEG